MLWFQKEEKITGKKEADIVCNRLDHKMLTFATRNASDDCAKGVS